MGDDEQDYWFAYGAAMTDISVMLNNFQTTIIFIIDGRWYKVKSDKRYVRQVIKKYGVLEFEKSDDLVNWINAEVVVAGDIGLKP